MIIKILNGFMLTVFVFLAKLSPVMADEVIGVINPPRGIKGNWGMLAEDGPSKLIGAIIAFVVAIAVAIFFIKIILAGIRIITNSKDPAQFGEGMKAIMWGTIGILIVASAYMIVSWVGVQLFGSPESLLQPLEQLPK